MNAGRAIPLVVAVAALAGFGWAFHRAQVAEGESAEAEIRAFRSENARASAERDRDDRAKESGARIEELRKKVAELEAAAKDREKELLAIRADLERSRRVADEVSRQFQEIAAAQVSVRLEKVPPKEPPLPAKPPETRPPSERPPPPDLGPTAVSDKGQVKKLVDGLNTLLAGVGGEESWKVVSAGAAEDDRLVTVVLEARGAGGAVSKSFKAAEARFVLQAASGTLSIKLKEGSVTYPGNRTVPFPDGAYTVLLVVDSAPFRAAGHPLVSIQ